MKYDRSDDFKADYKRLSEREKGLFKKSYLRMNDAYAQRGNQALPPWPKSLRIRDVEGATGVFEMTWSFSGPDGRATFEIITIAGSPAIRWRRIGGHEIFRAP